MTSPTHIILVAPPGVPSCAVGKALAAQLRLPLRSPGDFSDDEWAAPGFEATADMLSWADGGAYANYRLHMPLRLRAAEKLLRSPERSVIVLPPNYVVHEEQTHHAVLAALLASTPHVLLLLPPPDARQNERLLDADLRDFPDFSIPNAHFVRHPSNERLAKQIVYTEGRTREQTRDELLSRHQEGERPEIVLIGPKLAGKSTLVRLLADALGVPQVSLDTEGRQFMREISFDFDESQRLRAAGDLLAWLEFNRPLEAHVTLRALAEYRGCVMDFGAGHSYYSDEALFARVQAALAPFPNVFLILPSADKETSIAVLKARFEADAASERQLHRLLVTHSGYGALARHTLYTHERDVEAVSAEAAAWVGAWA